MNPRLLLFFTISTFNLHKYIHERTKPAHRAGFKYVWRRREPSPLTEDSEEMAWFHHDSFLRRKAFNGCEKYVQQLFVKRLFDIVRYSSQLFLAVIFQACAPFTP